MRAHASASCIPCPVKRDTAVPVNSHTATSHQKPTVKTADIVRHLASLTISKPTNRAIPHDGLTDKQRLSVSARILECCNAVVAKLGLPIKRATVHSVKATAPSQRPVHATHPAKTAPAPVKPSPPMPTRADHPMLSISPSVDAPLAKRGAPYPSIRPRRYVGVTIAKKMPDRPGMVVRGSIWSFAPIPMTKDLWDKPTSIPTRMRDPDVRSGDIRQQPVPKALHEVLEFYCPARPHQHGHSSWHGYGVRYFGRPCRYHGDPPFKHYLDPPKMWTVSPAQANQLQPDRPRRVHFNETIKVSSFEKWYEDTYGAFKKSSDEATIEDDEEEMDSEEDIEPVWKESVVEGLPEDDDED